MKTIIATEKIADWLNTGTLDIPDLGVCLKVSALMGAAVTHGRAWRWGLAEKNINAAYRILGANPTGTRYQWHCGTHPIQLASKSSAVLRLL